MSLIAIPLLLLAGTVHAADVKTDIESVNQKLGAAYAKGNAATIAQLYTTQATMFPPGSDIIKGWEKRSRANMSLSGSR